MKRFIIFILCLTVSVVTLMLAVNAADPTFGTPADPIPGMGQVHLFGDQDHGSGDHHDGWYESKYEGKPNNDGFARVKLVYTKNNTSYSVTYPTYYILENDSTLRWNFTKVSEYLGVELNVGNIAEIEIPYGITVIPEKCFVLPGAFNSTVSAEHPEGHVEVANETLSYVFVPNTLLEIQGFAFAHCSNLATFASNHSSSGATGDHNHQMLQSIGNRAFHNCESLTAFNFNNHLISLGDACFEGCALAVIDLSKCIELTIIPKNCFHEADGRIEKIVLPVSVEILGDNAFTGAHAEFVFLGTSLKEVGHNAIALDNVSVLIIPDTIEVLYSDSFKFGNKGYQPYIVGAHSAEDVENLFAVLKAAGYTGLKQINNPSKVYSDSQKYFADTSPSFCLTYLGGHTINHQSNTITSVVYPNGIGHAGYATGACGICQQELDTQIQLTPIMVAKGYSICTYNNLSAFSNGFEIYHDALDVYERVYGVCELGILFMLKDNYTAGSDIFDEVVVSKKGIYLDEATMAAASGIISYTSMDFIMTYSKGLDFEYEVTKDDGTKEIVKRREVEMIISGVLHHKETLAAENYHKALYLQDTDDLCIDSKTDDGKYVSVSYDSIYGYIRAAGLE